MCARVDDLLSSVRGVPPERTISQVYGAEDIALARQPGAGIKGGVFGGRKQRPDPRRRIVGYGQVVEPDKAPSRSNGGGKKMKKTFLILILGLFLAPSAFITSCKQSSENTTPNETTPCTAATKSCCQEKRTACEKDCDEENRDADSRRICKVSCRDEYYDCIEKAHD
jgi:hypothetical protein